MCFGSTPAVNSILPRAIRPALVAMSLAALPLLPTAISAQEPAADSTATRTRETDGRGGSLPMNPTRKIELSVDEGSWMSLDVSPDGSTIVFDLLGDLYTLPITGGAATQLTSGMAYDAQPRFSPDGERIAFISDRSGGQNVWLMSLHGGEFEALTEGDDDMYTSPEWTPDGSYIVVSKTYSPLGGSAKLWLYHVEGGSGAQLIREPENLKTLGAAFGAEARHIWYAQRTGDWQYDAMLPIYQLAVYDRRTGESTVMSNRYGSAFRPTLSPDGRWLVYGTRHDAATALRVRDLTSGEERWLAYPVQRDDQESRAALDVLPGMAFMPDSERLIVSYGGRIWMVPIDGREPSQIPFRADVALDLGPLLQFEYAIDDDPTFNAGQIRDIAPSPDGSRIAFTALNRLYIGDTDGGPPRRMTTPVDGEFGPVWSPDSRSLAYITWSDTAGGHIWRVAAAGGTPRRLTSLPGLYRDLAWSPRGDRIVALRAAASDISQMATPTAPAEFVWVPAAGGALTVIAPAAGRNAPHFTVDTTRIYAYSSRQGLVSFRWDGTDVQTHVRVTGPRSMGSQQPPQASRILMAPRGDLALAQVVNDLYVVTVPKVGGPVPTISVADPDRAAFPARRLTTVGGHFPAWAADGRSVHWSLGNRYFQYDLDAAEAAESEPEPIGTSAPGDTAAGASAAGDEPSYEPRERQIEVPIERDLPTGTAVLRGARVITMRGDDVIENADIVIRGNRIQAVGARGEIVVPDDAEIIPLEGTTIVPGFVDTHYHPQSLATDVHTSQVWQYLATLAYGTTTTRDPQTGSSDVLTYADRVESGDLIGPRIYSTGPGVGRSEPVLSLDHARDVLRRYSEYYDTRTLKMYMAGNRRQRQWIAMAAAELRLMPTTEGGMDMALNLTHMIDGYSGVEHNLPITPLYEDVVTLLAHSGTVNSPTLVVSYGGPLAMNRFFTRGDLHDNPKIRMFYPHDELDRRTRRRGMGGRGSYGPGGWFMDDEYVDDEHARFINRVVEAGGRIGVGGHGEFQGLGYHWEMAVLASGGMTPHEVLRSATLTGAEAIGLSRDIGSIETGKMADLVVLSRNPLEDIDNTRAIRYVMKNGRLYEGSTLAEIWPRTVAGPVLAGNEGPRSTAAGIQE